MTDSSQNPFEKESYSKARKALAERNRENEILMKQNAELNASKQGAHRHMERAMEMARASQKTVEETYAELAKVRETSNSRAVEIV